MPQLGSAQLRDLGHPHASPDTSEGSQGGASHVGSLDGAILREAPGAVWVGAIHFLDLSTQSRSCRHLWKPSESSAIFTPSPHLHRTVAAHL